MNVKNVSEVFFFIRKYILFLMLLIVARGSLMAQCTGGEQTPFEASRGGLTMSLDATTFAGVAASNNVIEGGLLLQGGNGSMSGDGNNSTPELQINGDLQLTNNATLTLTAGAQVFVYGNLYISAGSTLDITNGNIYIFGEQVIVDPTSEIIGGSSGNINFISPRPANGTPDAVTGINRPPDPNSGYNEASAVNVPQYFDAGGTTVNAVIQHYNANNIILCDLNSDNSGDLTLAQNIVFNRAEGDVILNQNDVVFTNTITYVHSGVPAYDAYFVTNGTGVVTKEGILNDGFFVFPVGQAENDYTPADVSNLSGAPNSYSVQVKTYAASGSTESAPTEGIDRTWQIYGSNGGGSFICLAHNSVTNAAGTGTDGSSFDNANAFITQQTSTGAWSSDLQSDGGSPVSNHCSNFTTVTTSSDPASYFTKSSDPVTPLPVTLTAFEGNVSNCTISLKWTTATEINNDRYVLQYSTNGTDFISVAIVPSKNSEHGATYTYNYQSSITGINYFRLLMIDLDGESSYSPVISFRSNCGNRISISPNPVQNILTIKGLNTGAIVMIFNANGQQVETTSVSGSILNIPTSSWGKGLYNVMIIEGGKIVKTEKVIKQ